MLRLRKEDLVLYAARVIPGNDKQVCLDAWPPCCAACHALAVRSSHCYMCQVKPAGWCQPASARPSCQSWP